MKFSLLALSAGQHLSTRDSSWVNAAGEAPKPPANDTFYQFDNNALKDLPNGHVIKHRQVEIGGLHNVKKAYQLLYKSQHTNGTNTATVTTIITPANGTSNNMVSYQYAEDAAYISCAPSYELFSSTFGDVQELLNRGWIANVPDYEGPGSAFAASVLEGTLTLDSVRAVKNANNVTGVEAAQVALWGYSGGSIASGSAAELQKTHAPDLKIAAVAVGGYVVDVEATVLAVNNSPFVGFVPAGVLGLASEYSDLWSLFDTELKPDRRQNLTAVLNQCTGADILDFAGEDVFTWFKDGKDVLQNKIIREVFDQNRLGKTAPSIPMYVYQGVEDQIAPVSNVDEVVKFLCKEGTPVVYDRLRADHIGAASNGPKALDFIEQVFNGKKPSKCTFQGIPISSNSSTNGTTGHGNSTSSASTSASSGYASGSATGASGAGKPSTGASSSSSPGSGSGSPGALSNAASHSSIALLPVIVFAGGLLSLL